MPFYAMQIETRACMLKIKDYCILTVFNFKFKKKSIFPFLIPLFLSILSLKSIWTIALRDSWLQNANWNLPHLLAAKLLTFLCLKHLFDTLHLTTVARCCYRNKIQSCLFAVSVRNVWADKWYQNIPTCSKQMISCHYHLYQRMENLKWIIFS